MPSKYWFSGICVCALSVTLVFAQGTKKPKAKEASGEDPTKTNCEECLKDTHTKQINATKAKPPQENPHSPHTVLVEKNLHYAQPPTVLGEGHELLVELEAPGKILSIEPVQFIAGEGCGWTHHVQFIRNTDRKATWVGWSNSGHNCTLKFTVHYE